MNVDIYIREVTNSSGREIRIPWLPEIINCETGDASVVSYDIMNVGEVVVPTGVGLSKYSWESIFPGTLRTDTSMLRGESRTPSHYDDILKYWKNNRTKLCLVVTGYPINVNVYLTSYNSKANGAFGDIEYSIFFTEARDITIVSSANQSVNRVPTVKRSTTTEIRYTVKTGDTLWSIAEAYLGSGMNYYTIYQKNKAVIEEVAYKHRRRSSENGRWIYPGTILLLP